jgi:N-formylglutamate deformylase
MSVVETLRGSSPVILGLPHTGTEVPPDIWAKLNEEGKKLRDTDWHIHRLYEGLPTNATTVRATFHRYVIDANRDPTGASLYPGQNTTGLVPLTDFDDQPIWIEGAEPDGAETARRLEQFHQPYHDALAAEIDRVKALHGIAVVYDCHSIRSVVPYLFEGELPVFNIGTNEGTTCARAMEVIAYEFAASSPYSTVLNGRFKGGWTTRHYGRPADGVHAIQMEIAQRAYLAAEQEPWAYDAAKAERLRRWLRDILAVIEETAFEIGGKR